jgi:hypothetical protein
MRFISVYPNLQVILQNKKRIVEEGTGAVVFENKAIKVKFDLGVFETQDEKTISLMLLKIEDHKNKNLPLSYSVHLEDLPMVEYFLEKNQNVPQEQNETTELKKTNSELMAEIADLKKQVAELSHKKNNKKSPVAA